MKVIPKLGRRREDESREQRRRAVVTETEGEQDKSTFQRMSATSTSDVKFERARYSTVCIVKEEEKSGGVFNFFFLHLKVFVLFRRRGRGRGEGLLSRSRSLRIHLVVFRALYIPVTVGYIYIYIFLNSTLSHEVPLTSSFIPTQRVRKEKKKSSNP